MATLKAIYDHESGQAPIQVRTQGELEALIERVRAYSTGCPCPAVVEITVMEDPWGFPRLYAGIGEDRGYVQELPPGGQARATVGDHEATGVVIYDLQGHELEVPANQEVSLSVVRAALSAYLTCDGTIPANQPGLQLVGA